MFHFLVQETNVTHALQVEREDDVKTLFLMHVAMQQNLFVTTEGYERRRRGNRDLYYYSLRVFYYAQIHTQSAIIE